MRHKDQKIELLSQVPLLSRCSKGELRQIARLADLVDFKPGATLMTEGSRGAEFFVIVDGAAEVIKDGHRLAELGAGDWVGEIALLTDVPRTATVVASTELETLVLTRQGLSALIHDVPTIGTKVLAAVGERLAEQTTTI